MNEPIQGRILSECFTLVSNCGSELEKLRKELEIKLVDKIEAEKQDLPYSISGSTRWSNQMDESGWVYTDTACCIPLKLAGKGRRRTEKYLGFQISMAGPGIGDGIENPVFQNPEPLLHVIFWNDAIDFPSIYMGFPLETDDENDFQVKGRLIRWSGGEGWNYSLRLTKLNSSEDLEKYVINPAIELLKMKLEETYLPLPDDDTILSYPDIEKLKTPG
jgi:hypothetical protein